MRGMSFDMDGPPTTASAPAAWSDALAQAREDVAAGRICDAEDFLAELHAEDAELQSDAVPPQARPSSRAAR